MKRDDMNHHCYPSNSLSILRLGLLKRSSRGVVSLSEFSCTWSLNGNQKCSDFGNSECSIFGIKTTVLLASAVQ